MPATRSSSTHHLQAALLPSGVLRAVEAGGDRKGVVFDPQAFLDEVTTAERPGRRRQPGESAVAETSR